MPTGRDVIPMSEAQKYLFDLKGFVLLPALLSEEELVAIPRSPDEIFSTSASPCRRTSATITAAPSQILLDHPAVVGVLNEVLSHQALASEECYGFRYDHTYTSHRQAGHDNFGPHGGGGYFNFRGNSHIYQMQSGQGAFRIDESGVGAQRSRRGRWGHAFSCRAATRPPSPGPTS